MDGQTRDNVTPLLTLDQVAQVLGVHYTTVMRWVRSGEIAPESVVRLSAHTVRVTQDGLRRFIDSRRDAAPVVPMTIVRRGKGGPRSRRTA